MHENNDHLYERGLVDQEYYKYLSIFSLQEVRIVQLEVVQEKKIVPFVRFQKWGSVFCSFTFILRKCVSFFASSLTDDSAEKKRLSMS